MRIFYRFFYVFAIFITIFFVITSAITITLNTPWGKKKIVSVINDFSKEQKINVSFEKLGGFLPFLFTFTDVKLQLDENKSVEIEKLSFRPSYLKLLKNTLSFKTLTATNVHALGFDKLSSDEKALLFDKLDYAVQIKSLALNKLQIAGIKDTFNLRGKIRIEKDFSYISINSHITGSSSAGDFVNVKLRASKDRFASVKLDAKVNNLRPYLDVPVKGSSSFKIYLKGSFDSFVSFLLPSGKNLADIEGTFDIFIEEFNKVSMPFASDLKINGNVSLNPNGNILLKQVLAFNDYLDAKGFLALTSFKDLQKANFFYNVYSIPNLKTLRLFSPIKGSVDLQKKGVDYSLLVKSDIDTFMLNDLTFSNSDLLLNAQIINKKLQGACSLQSTFGQRHLQLGADIAQTKDYLDLSKIQFKSSFFHTNGKIRFYALNKILANFDLSIPSLSTFETIFPHLFIDGSMNANVVIDTVKNNKADLSMFFNDVEYDKVGTSHGKLTLAINSPFKDPTFKVNANLGPSRVFNTAFQTVSIDTDTEFENWPFEISTTGKSIDANLNGFWRFDNQSLSVNIQELFGTLYNQSFLLKEPTSINWVKEKEFQVSNFTINMENSYLTSAMSLASNKATFDLKTENFPIDFVTLNTLELAVQGTITGNMQFEYTRGNTNGTIDFSTKNTKLYTPDDNEELVGNAAISGVLKNNILDLNSNFQSDGKVLLDSFLSIGLQVTPMPLKISFLDFAPLKGKITYNSRAEDLLDFFDLGFNFLRGDLMCDLSLSGTLNAPNVVGNCSLTNGTYENYLAGVYLKHINAKIIGKQNKLELVELTANGIKDGKLNATGELLLSYAYDFPYILNANLDDIQLVKLDYFEGKLQGAALLQGSIKQAALTGTATITEGEFSIPEKFTSSVPTLAVTYVNVPEDFQLPVKKEKFDFHLDVALSAPKNIFVRGKGLTAELKGEMKLEGTIDNLKTKGRLDLIKGDFLFSGNSFDLTKGEFVFGEEGTLPFIYLSAQTTIQGIAITAILSGQFDSPTLEFRSLPPLPLSSILSYLLFGSDISEISALQAVSLASTAASLVGGRTDILEATRKKLGVDRLAVISSPSSSGEDDFAVQIGKYVAKGVLISISQGVEQGSTNIIVEVDLKHGFIFSAESIQQEEQGRFSLKWNRNF